MKFFSTPSLRKRISPLYADHLPEQVRYRDSAGNEQIVSTASATVDQLAFAIQLAAEEQSTFNRRRNALEDLYLNARKAGAIGADRLSDIAWKEQP